MFRAYQFSSPQDIDSEWIAQICTQFAGKSITITIEETVNETDFLLRNEANRLMLLESLMQDQEGNAIDYQMEKNG